MSARTQCRRFRLLFGIKRENSAIKRNKRMRIKMQHFVYDTILKLLCMKQGILIKSKKSEEKIF